MHNYTLKEAADHLRMHVRSVRNEIERGNLTAFRAGRRVLISEQEMEAYKARNQILPGESAQDTNGEDIKKVA